ncbi:MAG TPA: hypothetical protein VJX67_07910 [Blastocatellia bacterium]|nr:hypothetical protein [Blastocatellia bacterium]
MEDEKLVVDRARQLANQASVKAEVRDRVNSQISLEAGNFDSSDLQEASAVGRDLKRRAIIEAVETENEMDRARVMARISQIIDYVFYVIYGIIGMEIVLDLLGARESNSFKRLLDALAAPLVAPFNGLMPDPSRDHHSLHVSYIIGLLVYVLINLAINGLLRLIAHRRTTV